jgi:sugar lactone lactonase YvrE
MKSSSPTHWLCGTHRAFSLAVMRRLLAALFLPACLPAVVLGQSPCTPYAFTTLAGQPGTRGYTDGTGSTARFYGPAGLVADAAGNLYVADTCNSTIRKVTPAGGVSLFVGTPFDPETNRIGLGRADGTGTSAQFYLGSGVSSDGTPYGPPVFTQIGSINLAMDSGGNIYVADTLSNTIRKITAAGVVTTFAGLAPQDGSTDGTGSNARFLSPIAVAVDGSGNVYVADSGNGTVRKITATGVVTTFAGSSRTSGSADGTGANARFNSISGIAADSAGYVYVADTNNHTIRKITPLGAVSTLAGLAGAKGSSDGVGNKARFNGPTALALDSAGNLYVADTGNNTIRRVSPTGAVSTLAGLAGNSGSADGTGNAARFDQPYGLAVDSAGTVYVSDTTNNTVRKGVPVANAAGANLQLLSPPQTLYVKAGQSAVFTVSATASPAPTYQWQKDGEIIPGATGASYTIAATQYTDAGAFSVAVSSGAVTVTSGVATLRVFPPETDLPPIIVVGQPADQTVAAGQSATFTADVATTSAPTYQWMKNGAAIPSATRTTCTIANAQTSDAGSYTVVVTNTAGSKTSDPAVLTIAHNADVDCNLRIGLVELTRVIELYNTRLNTVRTGCYKVQAGAEDGFAQDATAMANQTLTRYHSADSNRDGQISLGELTRVIELYNTRSGTTRTGQYHVQAGTEDGFAPGP